MPELLAIEPDRRLRRGDRPGEVRSSIAEGQSLALLGRNGMGKTTLVNSIIGVTRYLSGTIRLDGANITRLRPDQRAHAGIGWVPQERNIFKSLTVEENLTAVARPGPWTTPGVRPVSAPRRAAPQSRQPAIRRRAADAGGRPRAGTQPPHHPARRAARGTRADHRRGTASGAQAHHTRGRPLGYPGGAERQKILGVTDRAVIIERGAIAHRATARRWRPTARCWRHISAWPTPTAGEGKSNPHPGGGAAAVSKRWQQTPGFLAILRDALRAPQDEDLSYARFFTGSDFAASGPFANNDTSGKAEIACDFQRPDHPGSILRHVGGMVKSRASPLKEHQIVRVVLSIQERPQ